MKHTFFLFIFLFISSLSAEWQEVPSLAWQEIHQLAMGDSHTIWALVTLSDQKLIGERVYKWENNAWVGPKGDLNPDWLAVGHDNMPYALKQSKLFTEKQESKIYTFNGTTWIPILSVADRVMDFYVVNKNDIWITKKMRPLYYNAFHWDGKEWQQKGNENIWTLSVGTDGIVIGNKMTLYINDKVVSQIELSKLPADAQTDSTSSLVRWDGSAWQTMSNLGNEVTFFAIVDRENIWVTKGDNPIYLYPYKWDSQTKQWIKKGDKTANQIIATTDGLIFIRSALENKIYKWTEPKKNDQRRPHMLARRKQKRISTTYPLT